MESDAFDINNKIVNLSTVAGLVYPLILDGPDEDEDLASAASRAVNIAEALVKESTRRVLAATKPLTPEIVH